jgi:hypothetical protein
MLAPVKDEDTFAMAGARLVQNGLPTSCVGRRRPSTNVP